MPDVEDYSTTAASNTTDFPEGQAPSTVNNAGRETQADIAAMYQRDNAIITAGGTADALTGTFSPAHTTDVAGRVVIVQAASNNATTTPTFQLDSLTARTITKDGGVALAAGDIKAGSFIILKYDLTNTVWELLNPMRAPTAATGASMVLLATQTASNSATVDFTTNIDGTYDHYVIKFTNVDIATTGSTLYMRFSIAGTFVTAGNYRWMNNENYAAATTTPLGSASDTVFRIANSMSADPTGNAYSALEGEIHLSSPDNTTYDTRYWGHVTYESTADFTTAILGGNLRDTAAVDGVRFYPSSGNINSGLFRLYGIKDA